MRLIQVRVRCVAGVEDTGWFVPGRKTSVLYGPPGNGKTALLEALEALNPPYDIDRCQPFADHPESWQQQEYVRRVIPEKKTAVFMVFSARPEQVRLLADFDPDLIETDRIEVGRRLDHSRWTTFVEISASARWSDVAKEMNRLQKDLKGCEGVADFPLARKLRSADRLKGEIGEHCQHWLEAIASLVPEELAGDYQQCLRAVGRRQRFRQAEQQVAQWLPLTIRLTPDAAATAPSLSPNPESSVISAADHLVAMFFSKINRMGQSAVERIEFARQLSTPLRQLFTELGLRYPDLDWQDGRLQSVPPPGNTLQQRCWYTGLVCQLAMLIGDSRPLLLFDDFTASLAGNDKALLIDFIQRLADWCQILVATADREVVDRQGWHCCLRLEEPGLDRGGRIVTGP